ncbi:MAG: hypothetical protein GF330_00555, partial [Candidatus Eisenbacteria bacterium]|nr:hypothetical protein [Candidatus Eisenbacteria bacterium]
MAIGSQWRRWAWLLALSGWILVAGCSGEESAGQAGDRGAHEQQTGAQRAGARDTPADSASAQRGAG